jgi:predicted  nucleic acid-binding Zn-ribbon protein
VDPVVLTALATVIVGGLSGLALVLSSRSNSNASATAVLVEGQGRAISRMEAQIAARDSMIEDLRANWQECETNHGALKTEFERQSHELNATKQSLEAAHESIDRQGAEIVRLRARVTELGDERLP